MIYGEQCITNHDERVLFDHCSSILKSEPPNFPLFTEKGASPRADCVLQGTFVLFGVVIYNDNLIFRDFVQGRTCAVVKIKGN